MSPNKKQFLFWMDTATAAALVRLSKERDQSKAAVLRCLVRQAAAQEQSKEAADVQS